MWTFYIAIILVFEVVTLELTAAVFYPWKIFQKVKIFKWSKNGLKIDIDHL